MAGRRRRLHRLDNLAAVVALGVVLAASARAQTDAKKADIYAIAAAEAAKRTGEKLVVIDKEGSVTADYPDQVDQIRLEVLTTDQLIAKSKAEKKAFYVLKTRPAETAGALLMVAVMQDSFSGSSRYGLQLGHGLFIGKRRKVEYGASGWFNVFFELDSATQTYRVVKVEAGGI